MKKRPIVLCIMDGYGISERIDGNAVKLANTPNLDDLMAIYPTTTIKASGMPVGLPDGQMGNSEVGHLNIGAGRTVYQSLTLINKAVADGSFYQNEEFLKAIKNAKDNNTKLHIWGLLSNGGVHSSNEHIYALLKLAKQEGLEKVYVHAFLDGRDVAPDSGVDFVNDNIVEVDFSNRPFVCSSENGHSFKARAVIIATGSSAKWLNLSSEKKFLGYGVSACATCDGFFYRGRTVAVIGGGNSAAAEALYLASLADKVILVHRRHQLRADKILQDRILNNKKIVVEWDSVVEEILGEDEPLKVTGVKLRNVENDEIKTVPLDGVFIAVGHQPNTEIFKEHLVLDGKGYIVTRENSSATNVDGVFAAGDVKDPKYKQAVISAGSGAMAAMDAIEYLDKD